MGRLWLRRIVQGSSSRPVCRLATISPEEVSEDVLHPSDKKTECPYKGVASYYSVQAGGETREAIAWYYPTPIPAAAGIEGHLCFYNEKVDLEVDGEAQQRPQWS
jgi:uncharacterized protein (DUF427 family)